METQDAEADGGNEKTAQESETLRMRSIRSLRASSMLMAERMEESAMRLNEIQGGDRPLLLRHLEVAAEYRKVQAAMELAEHFSTELAVRVAGVLLTSKFQNGGKA